MKYLVNRETKEHIRYHEDSSVPLYGWDIVEADDEGWIEWRGKSQECPLPDDAKVAVLFSYDNNPCGKLPAKDWRWSDETLTHYRPILPAESKPEPENAWPDDGMPASVYIDVFKRFNAAVAASESIPALIAEINAMLPEGYEVREKAKPEAVTEDMSDWRNWKEGDILECTSWSGTAFTVGEKYHTIGEYIISPVMGYFPIETAQGLFKFHSRPEAK